jgi:hypothetical protein
MSVNKELKLEWEPINSKGKLSWGWISWDQNSTFSGDQIFDHEVKIVFVHEVEFVQ